MAFPSLTDIYEAHLGRLFLHWDEEDAEEGGVAHARGWMDLGRLKHGTIVRFFPKNAPSVEAYVWFPEGRRSALAMPVHRDPVLATHLDVLVATGERGALDDDDPGLEIGWVVMLGMATPIPPSFVKRGVVLESLSAEEAKGVDLAKAGLLSDSLVRKMVAPSFQPPGHVIEVTQRGKKGVLGYFLQGVAAGPGDPRFRARDMAGARLRRLRA
jgi:hypothetical protein